MVENDLDRLGDCPERRVLRAAELLGGEDSPDWHSGDLPWRRDRTAYRVFLAEFLLVRTHTDRVAALFEGIVDLYPDYPSLAAAEEESLAEVLKPFGLRKRVPVLIEAAKYIINELGGKIPSEPEALRRIPGIGLYTSEAIAAFAFGKSFIPADVNVLRFLSRLTGLEMKDPTKGSKQLRALLPLLSERRGGRWSEVLLDFTRVICRPRNPLCEECPLEAECQYCDTSMGVNPAGGS